MRKLFLFLFAILLVGSVSAMTWDNRLNYENLNKISITDNLGLGSKLAEVEKLSNTDYCLNECSTTWKVTIYSSDDNFLDLIKFKTETGSDKTINYKFEYISGYTKETKQQYEYSSCTEAGCGKKYLGDYEIETPIWNEFNPSQKLEAGTYTIKLTGYKETIESIDWIPTIYGKEVSNWAWWYGTAPIGYWKLNEAVVGDNATDSSPYEVHLNDTTAIDEWEAGKLNNAIKFDTTSDFVTKGSRLGLTNATDASFTIAMWYYSSDGTATAYDYALSSCTTFIGAGCWAIELDRYNKTVMFTAAEDTSGTCFAQSHTFVNDSTWHRIVAARDGTSDSSSLKLYIDNVLEDTTDCLSGNKFSGQVGSEFTIGKPSGSAAGVIADIDDVQIYRNLWTATDVATDWNSGSGQEGDYEAGTPLVAGVDLTSPSGIVISSSTLNFTANYSSSGGNLTNATLYIWDSTSAEIDTAYNDLIGTENSTENEIDVSGYDIGTYYWNEEACAVNETDVLCVQNEDNYTFSKGATFVSINYNLDATETSTQTYSAEFQIIAGSEISQIQLDYDGTNYTITNFTIAGTNLTFSKDIDLPLNTDSFGTESNNFLFRFTYAGGSTQESTEQNQNVSYINLQLCNDTETMQTLNFTYKDELTGDIISSAENLTSMNAFFTYWAGSGDTYKNYSTSNLSSTSPSYTFCLHPDDATLKTNMDMEYDAIDYSPRSYQLRNASLTNVSSDIDLLLLGDETAVKFFFTLKKNLVSVGNAIVTISKYDVGSNSWKTIGIRETDDYGKFIEYQQLDKQYRYYVVQDLVYLGTVERTSICSATPCEQDLELGTSANLYSTSGDDFFASGVVYNLSYDTDNKMITYTFLDVTGLANYFRLQVNLIEMNQSGSLICNVTSYSTAGTLTCNMTGYTGQGIAQTFVSRSPEKQVGGALTFVLSVIADVLGKGESLLFTLIVIVTVALVGFWSPIVGIVMTCVIFLFAIMAGFVAVSWAAGVLIFLLAIILIVKMGTRPI